MPENKIYRPVITEKFTVQTFHTGFDHRLKLNYLTAFLQEAAWNHAQHLDFGIEYMHNQGMAWMISRIKVIMDEYPAWMEEITIETWPKGVDGLFWVRDFVINDGTGKKIGTATSYWLQVDLKTKRPRVPGPHTEVLIMNKDRHAVNEKLVKIKAGSSVPICGQRAEYCDLDLNNHVNSNKYVEWVVNCLKHDDPRNWNIHDFQINFMNELKWGEEIGISMGNEPEGQALVVEGVRADDGKPCFQARITFR